MPKDNTPNTPRQDIVAFLNEIGNVQADKINPAFKSKYASLAEILDTVKAVASKHNLAVFQRLTSADGQVRVTTSFIHSSVDNVEMDAGTLAFKSEGLDAQKLGSAITYLRRQSLQTACGISTDVDDDGAKASQAPSHSRSQQPEAWFDFIPESLREKAVAYLVGKTWIPQGGKLSDLPLESRNIILGNQTAFIKAISK